MPKAVGRVKADLQRIALLRANGVRPIAAARMRRRLERSSRLEASACRADLRNCVDWKPARRRDGIWIQSGRRFQATRRDWRRSAAASAQNMNRWLPVYPAASSAPTCPPDRNIRLQSSAECRGVRILIEWDSASQGMRQDGNAVGKYASGRRRRAGRIPPSLSYRTRFTIASPSL